MSVRELIQNYYDAFNEGRSRDMLTLLHDDIEHHVNEGDVRHGRRAFEEFNKHMEKCYKEYLSDLIIFVDEDASRGAAEFIVNGTYLHDDEGLPAARGQKYRLSAGAFFVVREGKIARVTTYYNLNEWTKQVLG